ncbi:hypothetical protein GCM10010193_43590 [Kitasatospora atroaurantiaca]|uniref:Secreted protein n=1 Tax=Kitasatospora atroaurantiaca TaxID=285545 RepID=A0A561ETN4_9ACTN|nr:hypothetical protein FB465_4074 [Kitasatospora atroaurantiaca]
MPPIATGVLVVAAVAALTVSPDPALVRSLGVAAVLAAVGLGLLLRQRDRAARVAAELAATRRLRAEERFEEQLAEVEYAAEVAEERATRFGRRLTAEKSRLAKAETEIARLLRERAVMVAEQALKEAEATQRALAAARPKFPASPAAYVRAASVLRQLEQEAERAEARRESPARTELAVRPRVEQPVAAPQVTVPQVTALQVTTAPQPVLAAPKPASLQESVATRHAVGAAPTRPVLAATAEPLAGAPATAIVPAERQRPRPQAGAGRGSNFSFFGRSGAAGAAVRAAAPAPAVGSVTELGERADLADVVGDEALAESARYADPAAPAPEVQAAVAAEARPTHTRPEVVDLTPHDETEYLELPELRANRR